MSQIENNWRKIVVEWLENQGSPYSYVGDIDESDLGSLCLDGWFNLEILATAVRTQAINEDRSELKKRIMDKIYSAGGIGGLRHLEEIIDDALHSTTTNSNRN